MAEPIPKVNVKTGDNIIFIDECISKKIVNQLSLSVWSSSTSNCNVTQADSVRMLLKSSKTNVVNDHVIRSFIKKYLYNRDLS